MTFSPRLFVVLGIFLVSSCATDQELAVNSIEITGFGIFEYNTVRIERDETSSVGAKLGPERGFNFCLKRTAFRSGPGSPTASGS